MAQLDASHKHDPIAVIDDQRLDEHGSALAWVWHVESLCLRTAAARGAAGPATTAGLAVCRQRRRAVAAKQAAGSMGRC